MARQDMENVPFESNKEAELRAQVEGKLGKLNAEKIGWQRREDEREAKARRQHALELATKVVTSALDWSDDNGSNSETAGERVLRIADRYAKWLETGQLPA